MKDQPTLIASKQAAHGAASKQGKRWMQRVVAIVAACALFAAEGAGTVTAYLYVKARPHWGSVGDRTPR